MKTTTGKAAVEAQYSCWLNVMKETTLNKYKSVGASLATTLAKPLPSCRPVQVSAKPKTAVKTEVDEVFDAMAMLRGDARESVPKACPAKIHRRWSVAHGLPLPFMGMTASSTSTSATASASATSTRVEEPQDLLEDISYSSHSDSSHTGSQEEIVFRTTTASSSSSDDAPIPGLTPMPQSHMRRWSVAQRAPCSDADAGSAPETQTHQDDSQAQTELQRLQKANSRGSRGI
jgi:hypothetical protein